MASYADSMTADDFIDTNIKPNLSYAFDKTKEYGRSLTAATPKPWFQAGAGVLAALFAFSAVSKFTGAGNYSGITGMAMNIALLALSAFAGYQGFKSAFNASAGLHERIVNGPKPEAERSVTPPTAADPAPAPAPY